MSQITDILDPIQSILAQVQFPIEVGYGIVGQLLGQTCDVFRASSANDPLDEINHLVVVRSMFDTDPLFSQKAPRKYKDGQMFASCSREGLQLGDYLVSQTDGGIYFVNALEDIPPIGVVLCNNSIKMYRPTMIETNTGYLDPDYPSAITNVYGGNVDNLGTLMAENWPCSYLLGTKGERTLTNLPGDARAPWYAVKMPKIPGVRIITNDLIVDGNNHRYLISSVEESEHGLNLTVDQVIT